MERVSTGNAREPLPLVFVSTKTVAIPVSGARFSLAFTAELETVYS